MCTAPESPEQTDATVGDAGLVRDAELALESKQAKRAAALAQWRIDQVQRESKLTPDQRLSMLEELAQIAYRLHGAQRSALDESPAVLLAMRAQLRGTDGP